MPSSHRDAFSSDLSLAQETSRSSVVPSRANAQDNTWVVWENFCLELAVDPLLNTVPDPIHYLMVFAVRYRDGRLAKDGYSVRAWTVEDAIRAVGQTMASLGSKDHHLIGPRTLEYRLSKLFSAWKRIDPAPTRVKPVPSTLVEDCVSAACITNDVYSIAVADMTSIGFFYLNRPGEHTYSAEEGLSSPFTLKDVVFYQGAYRLPPTALYSQLHAATFALLTYTNQKNAVSGETIGHGRTRHVFFGPVKSLARRVEHLRRHNAPPTTPLYTVYVNHQTVRVTSAAITSALRCAATRLYTTTGIPPSEVSARGLRPGGAMALLCAKVDPTIPRLVGRWRSDEMFRYLHPQAYPLMHTFAQQMMDHGNFSFVPGTSIPPAAEPLLNAVPLPVEVTA